MTLTFNDAIDALEGVQDCKTAIKHLRTMQLREERRGKQESKLVIAAREFVRRVECGEITSRRTYQAFKLALIEHDAK